MAKVFYTREDLISFGNFLLQTRDWNSGSIVFSLEVVHADIENWLEEEKVVTKAIADEE